MYTVISDQDRQQYMFVIFAGTNGFVDGVKDLNLTTQVIQLGKNYIRVHQGFYEEVEVLNKFCFVFYIVKFNRT